MACCKETTKQTEITNGLDLLYQSKELYAETLFKFRECHDLCISSGLFRKEILLQIAQCALHFHQMCNNTGNIARTVSHQWLDSSISFFENISRVRKPKETLSLLGRQAKEIGQCFKIIALWTRDIAAKFHDALNNTMREAEECKRRCHDAELRAEEVRSQLRKQRESKRAIRKKAEDTEEAWKIARIATIWVPVSLFVTQVGCSIAENRRKKASEIEKKTTVELNAAEAELRKKTIDKQRIEVYT